MSGLKKTINLYQAIGILVSTLLGSSIFIIPAIASTIAGKFVLISWIIMLLCILPVAVSFGELGVLYPNSGGTAFFIRKALGQRFENFTSWLYLSVVAIGPPVVVITGANYLGALIKATQQQILYISIVMILLMFITNLFGMEFTGVIQTIITSVIIGALIIIIALFIVKDPKVVLIDSSIMNPQYGDIFLILKSLPVIFWSFVGVEAVAHLSSEFKNVKKDFPKTLFISIFIVGVLCVLLTMIVLKYKSFGTDSLNSNYLVFLVDILIGNSGRYIIGTIGFLTCFATVNVYVLSFSRIIYSMSNNEVLPKFFSNTSKKNVPVNALSFCYLIVSCTIFLKFLLHVDMNNLILYANGVFISIYLLASIAGIILLTKLKRFMAIVSGIFCSILLWVIGGKVIFAVGVLIFSLIWDRMAVRKKKLDLKVSNTDGVTSE